MAKGNAIIIDWDYVDAKLARFWTGKEVAATLGIDEQTLYRAVRREFNVDFVDYRSQKRAQGAGHLRELQLKTAEKGDTTMQIFLGKQYLEQSDRQKIETINKIDINTIREKVINKLTNGIDRSHTEESEEES